MRLATLAACLMALTSFAAPFTARAGNPPPRSVLLAVTFDEQHQPARELDDAVRAAVRTVLKDARIIDESAARRALFDKDFLGEGSTAPFSAMTKALRDDAADAAARCAARGDGPLCLRAAADILWRRHADRSGADVTIVIWGSFDAEREAYQALLPPAQQGRRYSVSMHVGAPAAAGRMVQVRAAEDPAAVVLRGLPPLLAGAAGAGHWLEWPATPAPLPEVPAAAPPLTEVLARLDAAAAATSPAPLHRSPSRCRGPLPADLVVTPKSPWTELLSRTYRDAREAGLEHWEMTTARGHEGEDPRVAGPPLACTLAGEVKPGFSALTPGAIERPVTAWLSLDCGDALRRAQTTPVPASIFDDPAAAAVAVVEPLLGGLCQR